MNTRVMRMLAGALAMNAGKHALSGKHANAKKPPASPGERGRRARRAERAAKRRRVRRAIEARVTKKAGRPLHPVHPRDFYWYDVGLRGGRFSLQPPDGGGSYYGRYRAMYEAGRAAGEKATP